MKKIFVRTLIHCAGAVLLSLPPLSATPLSSAPEQENGNRLYRTTIPFRASASDTEAEYRCCKTDRTRIGEVLKALHPYRAEAPGKLMIRCAKLLLGTPYAAGTLEKDPEKLTVKVLETDCILFVESCTAFVLTARSGSTDPEDYIDQIRLLRYRNGRVDGYASRLHYTSAWILQNEAAGKMQEISAELGGNIRRDQRFSFMSRHSERYPQLAADANELRLIRATEEELNANTYYWIPPAGIGAAEAEIQDGDIVCFVAQNEGLDITHVGIACRLEDGSLHFIHASMKAGKVIVEPLTLKEYAKNGLRVVRLTL